MIFSKTKKDGSDYLSPIVVKELRQGMRSRAFVMVFIVFQMAMVLGLLVALASADRGRSLDPTHWLFWFVLCVTFIFALPMMGLNAVQKELEGNHLELISLTRLTSFRLVVGKWLALLSQSFILISSLLPYFLLRYFLGSVNLFEDMVTFALLCGFSVLTTGMWVGLSSIQFKVIKSLIKMGVALTLLCLAIAMTILIASKEFVSIGGEVSHMALIMVLFGVPFTIWVMEVGASKISPLIENHDARKRLLGLIMLSACLALYFLGIKDEVIILLSFVVTIVVGFAAILGEPVEFPSVYQPFVKRGFMGWWLGRLFFYPGWPSGFIYSLLMAAAWGIFMIKANPASTNNELVFFLVSIAGMFYFPAALLRFLFPRVRARKHVIIFMILQAVFIALFIFVVFLDEIFLSNFALWLTPLPPVSVYLIGSDVLDNDHVGMALMAVLITTTLSILLLFLLYIRQFRGFLKMEQWTTDKR